MKRWLVIIVALSFMMLPQLATAQLNDPGSPGSVPVFPKFEKGTFGTSPASEFEVTVSCPTGMTCAPTDGVKLRAH